MMASEAAATATVCHRVGSGIVNEHPDPSQEFAGNRRRLHAKEVFDLGGSDQQCDAVGKADRNRARDVLDGCAKAGETHDEQQKASHDSDQRQAAHAELHDDSGDDHDEGARRSADLST